MWDLRSSTRDWTCTSCIRRQGLTGAPGKSPELQTLNDEFCFVMWISPQLKNLIWGKQTKNKRSISIYELANEPLTVTSARVHGNQWTHQWASHRFSVWPFEFEQHVTSGHSTEELKTNQWAPQKGCAENLNRWPGVTSFLSVDFSMTKACWCIYSSLVM